MPTPLPSIQDVEEKYFKFQDPKSSSAYNTILDQEELLLKSDKPLMYVRVVGYLLIHAPNHTARAQVGDEVHSCGGSRAQKDMQGALIELGKMYVQYFIRIFKNPKGRTPAPSGHSSRPSFDTFKDTVKTTLVSTPQNHEQAKKNALIRDRFRCVLTGAVDISSVNNIKELDDEVNARLDIGEPQRADITQCAHILSESTNSNIEEGSKKREYAANAWGILSMFGYKNILEELEGEEIHRLENILILSSTAHEAFDTLSLWFEMTKTENRYNVKTVYERNYRLCGWHRVVNFTTTDPKLALPSAEYLTLHAVVAKVAHMSGAGEYLDDIYRRQEELDVLSPDGSSAEVLENALYPLIGSCIKAY